MKRKLIEDDPPLTQAELIALRLVGGRLNPEPSHALPQRNYQNPARVVGDKKINGE